MDNEYSNNTYNQLEMKYGSQPRIMSDSNRHNI